MKADPELLAHDIGVVRVVGVEADGTVMVILSAAGGVPPMMLVALEPPHACPAVLGSIAFVPNVSTVREDLQRRGDGPGRTATA